MYLENSENIDKPRDERWDYKSVDCDKKEAGRNRNWIRCQVEGMVELEKSSFCDHLSKNWFRQKKINGCQNCQVKVQWGIGNVYSLKVYTVSNDILIERKKVTL